MLFVLIAAGCIGYYLLGVWKEAQIEEVEEIIEEEAPEVEPETNDDTARYLRAIYGPVERKEARRGEQIARREFMRLVLELGERDDLQANERYSARRIGGLLDIDKDKMAGLTKWMKDSGALISRGESPQAGYMRPIGEDGDELSPDEIIERLPALPPPPDGVLPQYRVPDARQTQTDSTDRQFKTDQTEILVYGADGKPIL